MLSSQQGSTHLQGGAQKLAPLRGPARLVHEDAKIAHGDKRLGPSAIARHSEAVERLSLVEAAKIVEQPSAATDAHAADRESPFAWTPQGWLLYGKGGEVLAVRY